MIAQAADGHHRRTQLAIWAVGEAHRRRTQTDGRRFEGQCAPMPPRAPLGPAGRLPDPAPHALPDYTIND